MEDWNWIDLPFFILTATSLGAAATLYTRLLVGRAWKEGSRESSLFAKLARHAQ